MSCPICGGPYVIGGTNSHEKCQTERTERAKDFEFLRALRNQCDQRGLSYADFIAQVMIVIDRGNSAT